jgi:hypothetical protein
MHARVHVLFGVTVREHYQERICPNARNGTACTVWTTDVGVYFTVLLLVALIVCVF